MDAVNLHQDGKDSYNLEGIKEQPYQGSDSNESDEIDQNGASSIDSNHRSDEIDQPSVDTRKRAFDKSEVNAWTMRLLWLNHIAVFLLLCLEGFGSMISFHLDIWVQVILIVTTFGVSGAHIFRRALASLFS